MKKIISYLLCFCFSISMVFCVSEAGAVFLLISPGAAAQGTGEAQVARVEDAYTSYFNPAGLSFINRDEVVLQHCNWLPNLAGDIYFDFIGFNKRIASGTIGGHLIYLNLGAQDQTNESGLVLGQFRSYMTALALGYSTTLKPTSSIGFNFKIYHQRLADSAVSGEGSAGSSEDGASTDLAFDLGYLLKFGKSKQHNFGLAIQNIGPPIDFVDAEQADPAPTNMKLGFNFLLHETENSKIKMLFDMNKLLVASYQAMDWDGDGFIDGSTADPGRDNTYGTADDINEFTVYESDDWSHKDDWYDGVINAWLDDWYYGGDYDKSRPSGLAINGMLSHMWYEDGENGEAFDEYADGRIGGFEKYEWKHAKINAFEDNERIFDYDRSGSPDQEILDDDPQSGTYGQMIVNDDYNPNYGTLFKNNSGASNWFSDFTNVAAVNEYVYVPNYTGFCDEEYRSLSGANSDGNGEYIGLESDFESSSYGSMCYDANGTQFIPGVNWDDEAAYGDGIVYGGHAYIDMPNDGFGTVDVFDAHCDPEENYDCFASSTWNDNGLTGLVDIGDPSAVQVEGVDYSSHDGNGRCDGVTPEINCIEVDHSNLLTNGIDKDIGPDNHTRMDIEYDRNDDGTGEYRFSYPGYGAHNPYGYREVGSGDDRSFQNELEEVIYNFGIEYEYSNNFTLRAGFIYDLEGDIKNPTVGAGLKFNNYGFDFGYTSGETDHPRANTMFFSLSLGIGA